MLVESVSEREGWIVRQSSNDLYKTKAVGTRFCVGVFFFVWARSKRGIFLATRRWGPLESEGKRRRGAPPVPPIEERRTPPATSSASQARPACLAGAYEEMPPNILGLAAGRCCCRAGRDRVCSSRCLLAFARPALALTTRSSAPLFRGLARVERQTGIAASVPPSSLLSRHSLHLRTFVSVLLARHFLSVAAPMFSGRGMRKAPRLVFGAPLSPAGGA